MPTLLLTLRAYEFACHSKACAPPPAGTGGSKGAPGHHVKVNVNTSGVASIVDKFGPNAARFHKIAKTQTDIQGAKPLGEADHLGGVPQGMNRVPPPRGLTEVKLKDEHIAALLSYRGEDYNLINGSLRFGTDLGEHTKATNDVIHRMDEVFRMGSPTTQDITVYRVMGMDISDKIHDNGFVSTAYDRGVADRFAGEKNITHLPIIKITIPKGSHAVKLSDEFGKGESEVLLPRGANFEKQPDGSYRYTGSTPDATT